MTGLFESLISNAKSAAGQLRVRSALNPMLWMCAIVSLPAFGMAYFFREFESLSTTLIWVGGMPVAATILGFFYFMLFAPHRLQSEDFQLRHETLQIIRSKGSNVEILPSSLEAISNPAIAALPSPHEGQR